MGAIGPILALLGAADDRLEAWRSRARVEWRRRRLAPALTLGEGAQIGRDVVLQIGRTGRIVVADRAIIRHGADFKVDGDLTIGEDSLIGPWCIISVLAMVTIGRDVLVAERVSIRDHDHRYGGAGPIRTQGYRVEPVVIGDGTWIGANVVIRQGVELGAGCVVGANSVVTRSFPPGTVIAGLPAKAIGKSADNSQTTGHASQAGHPPLCPTCRGTSDHD